MEIFKQSMSLNGVKCKRVVVMMFCAAIKIGVVKSKRKTKSIEVTKSTNTILGESDKLQKFRLQLPQNTYTVQFQPVICICMIALFYSFLFHKTQRFMIIHPTFQKNILIQLKVFYRRRLMQIRFFRKYQNQVYIFLLTIKALGGYQFQCNKLFILFMLDCLQVLMPLLVLIVPFLDQFMDIYYFFNVKFATEDLRRACYFSITVNINILCCFLTYNFLSKKLQQQIQLKCVTFVLAILAYLSFNYFFYLFCFGFHPQIWHNLKQYHGYNSSYPRITVLQHKDYSGFVAIMYGGYYKLFQSTSVKQQIINVLNLLSFLVSIVAYLITLVFYFKIPHFLITCFDNRFHWDEKQKQEIHDIFQVTIILDLIIQDLPQIVIQLRNNDLNKSWNSIQALSITSSIVSLIFTYQKLKMIQKLKIQKI